jgi:hypothetical protein
MMEGCSDALQARRRSATPEPGQGALSPVEREPTVGTPPALNTSSSGSQWQPQQRQPLSPTGAAPRRDAVSRPLQLLRSASSLGGRSVASQPKPD